MYKHFFFSQKYTIMFFIVRNLFIVKVYFYQDCAFQCFQGVRVKKGPKWMQVKKHLDLFRSHLSILGYDNFSGDISNKNLKKNLLSCLIKCNQHQCNLDEKNLCHLNALITKNKILKSMKFTRYMDRTFKYWHNKKVIFFYLIFHCSGGGGISKTENVYEE